MNGTRRPILWNQFDLDQLQALADRIYGKQPLLSRWRLALLLDSAGMTMREYEQINHRRPNG